MGLFEEFSQLVAEFKKENIEYALCGGLAMEVWETRKILSWNYGNIPVVSPKGLIKLKSMRLSGQDQDDIKNLENIIDED